MLERKGKLYSVISLRKGKRIGNIDDPRETVRPLLRKGERGNIKDTTILVERGIWKIRRLKEEAEVEALAKYDDELLSLSNKSIQSTLKLCNIDGI